MNDKKTVSFGMALAIIFLPILVILLGGLVLRVGFLVPLMLATITASLLSIMAGFTWKEVEACIVNGVHRIIIVTCILFLVGTLIGVWIQAGVIPLFLYWGLKLLSPSMFLVSTVLICAVFSLMTGTSFGTIGTAAWPCSAWARPSASPPGSPPGPSCPARTSATRCLRFPTPPTSPRASPGPTFSRTSAPCSTPPCPPPSWPSASTGTSGSTTAAGPCPT